MPFYVCTCIRKRSNGLTRMCFCLSPNLIGTKEKIPRKEKKEEDNIPNSSKICNVRKKDNQS